MASGSSLKRAADVAGAWSKQPIESLEDRTLLLAAGFLDTSFGDGGMVIGDNEAGENGQTVVIQNDGKIVVAAIQSGSLSLVRFDTDGTLDLTFGGGDGQVTTAAFTPRASAIQSDGKIVVAGHTRVDIGSYDFVVARYNSDGSLDSSFADNGKLTTDFGTSTDFAYSVTVQSDGKIVVAGRTYHDGRGDLGDIAVARYNSDGSLDTTFDSDGKVITDFGAADLATSLAVQNDGKLVVVGETATGLGDTAFAVARYNADGTLDTAFSEDGKLTTTFGDPHSFGRSVVVQNNGQILVVGRTYKSDGSGADFALARYNSDGSLDTTFDGDGKLTADFGLSVLAESVSVQSDGKIVVAGDTRIAGKFEFIVARFASDGTPDTTFGNNGYATTNFRLLNTSAYDMALQPDGDIVVVGTTEGRQNVQSSAVIALARFVGITRPSLSIAVTDASKAEGNSESTPFTFTVTREDYTSETASVDYAVTARGLYPADANDFGGTFPSGTLNFAAGESSKSITINVSGDTLHENHESFFVELSNPSVGFVLGASTATGVITNDDLVDLTYAAMAGTALSAAVQTNGRFRVALGGIAQADMNPADVRSLTIIGGEADDTINLTGLSRRVYPNLTSVVLIGGAGNDTIIGSNFNETISGGAGDDSLSGGGGTDRLVEEIAAPTDPAVVSAVRLARTESRTKYTMAGLGADTVADIEEMSLAGSDGKDRIDVRKFRGNVTLSGNGGNDTLIGGAGNDSLDGGEGNDKLTGNGGNNQLAGGNGTDYVTEAGATNFVLTPSTLTGLGNETLTSIERASLTTANTSSRIDATAFRGVTILTGGSGNDTLLGGFGKDSISGGAGNDTLIGGNANDTLDGGAGDDALAGQNGHDLLAGRDGQDTVIGGVGRDTLTGGLGDDLLIGGFGKDSLDGEAGNDTGLRGQGGAARGGSGLSDVSASFISIEVIDEEWATLFHWE